MKAREKGFSLVEVVASVLVLSSASLAVTAAWRLADYKVLVTRLDDRAQRVLRECYEMQTFAPVESKPFRADGAPNNLPAVQGYLYHPWARPGVTAQEGSTPLDQVPYTLSITSDGKSMELRYEVPGFGNISQRTVRRSVGFVAKSLDP